MTNRAARRVSGALRSPTSWLRGPLRRAPLRLKLVAAVLLLVVVALVGSGVAARVTMDDYLVGRADTQLKSAVQSIAGRSAHGGRGGGAGDGDARTGQLPSAYVVATANAAGAIVSPPTGNLVDPGQPLPRLPERVGPAGDTTTTRTFTVDAVRGDGQWRVLSTPTTLSDGSAGTMLVALSLADVQNTVQQLTILLLVIGSAAVVAVAGVGYLVVRASLRPLRTVELTAAKIAAGDLSHRVPESDPRTEVGQLSGALNTMLARIETAFADRAASEHSARMSEERMRISEASARRSEERMRAFVADASHELRTPLTTIRGFAELYRQGAVDDEQDVRRLMSRIEGEAKRMGVLVEDLLLLARLDQERPLARRPVDVLALAGDAVHDTRVLAPDRVIRLDMRSIDPPPVVTGDEARLRQVLGNLLSNAVRYSPAGSPITVSVGTEISEREDRPCVVLTVADEGAGLSSEAAAHVFERFYRADAARNRDDGGTGLGLAIVAALVAGHGGYVDVVSPLGHGACFRVELPLADIARADG